MESKLDYSNIFDTNQLSNNTNVVISIGSFSKIDTEEELPTFIQKKSLENNLIIYCFDPYYSKINYKEYDKLCLEKFGQKLYIKYDDKDTYDYDHDNDDNQKKIVKLQDEKGMITIFHISLKLINHICENKWSEYLKLKYNIETPFIISNNLKTTSHYLIKGKYNDILKKFTYTSLFWIEFKEFLVKCLSYNNKVFINNRAIFNSKYPGDISKISLLNDKLNIKTIKYNFCSNLYLEKIPELSVILYELYENIDYRHNLYYSYDLFKSNKVLYANYL